MAVEGVRADVDEPACGDVPGIVLEVREKAVERLFVVLGVVLWTAPRRRNGAVLRPAFDAAADLFGEVHVGDAATLVDEVALRLPLRAAIDRSLQQAENHLDLPGGFFRLAADHLLMRQGQTRVELLHQRQPGIRQRALERLKVNVGKLVVAVTQFLGHREELVQDRGGFARDAATGPDNATEQYGHAERPGLTRRPTQRSARR